MMFLVSSVVKGSYVHVHVHVCTVRSSAAIGRTLDHCSLNHSTQFRCLRLRAASIKTYHLKMVKRIVNLNTKERWKKKKTPPAYYN